MLVEEDVEYALADVPLEPDKLLDELCLEHGLGKDLEAGSVVVAFPHCDLVEVDKDVVEDKDKVGLFGELSRARGRALSLSPTSWV